MVDQLGKIPLKALVASEGGPHLSLYLPTHIAANDTEQDIRRLRRMLQEAEKQLVEGWVRKVEVQEFLAPLSALLHDQAFWSQRQNGLAIFRSVDELHIYRLNASMEERISLAQTYLVRPILSVLHKSTHGFLLTLSERKAALFEVQDQSIQEVSVMGLPISMEQALNYVSVDRGQQSHSGGSTGYGRRSEVFHGQGGKPDSHHDDLRHYFRAVNEAIAPYLGDTHAPLVLACVDSSVSIYQEVNTYSGLLSEHVSGNVDFLEPQKLLQKTSKILQAKQDELRQGLVHKIREHLNTKSASDQANEVITGAFQGRIQTLFFDEHARVEGQFDPVLQSAVVYQDSAKLALSEFNTDLIEVAVQQTIRHNGDVYSCSKAEMPGHGPMAALFRY